MSQPIYVADAFTDSAFAGNPAAVCPLVAPRSEAWLKNVAAEMNLSETAFLIPEGGDFGLRWLTPSVEVDLCGHATLASAHVLWETGLASRDKPIRFHTKSGLLTAIQVADGIELDFPAQSVRKIEPPPGLHEGLGAKPLFVCNSKMDFLCELESDSAVRTLRPDFGQLANVKARGIIVTARSADPKFDFISRFFAPASGINEDPVTGSAHCALATFWAERLGKTEFSAYQASARGGVLGVRLVGDRVKLVGKAVTVWRGDILV